MRDQFIVYGAFLALFAAFWVAMAAAGLVTSDPAGKHPITVAQMIGLHY